MCWLRGSGKEGGGSCHFVDGRLSSMMGLDRTQLAPRYTRHLQADMPQGELLCFLSKEPWSPESH